LFFLQATLVTALLCFPITASAQAWNFLGAAGGIATLSADGRSIVAPAGIDTSLYKPENGAALQFFGGRHLTDFVSVQAGYGWNRNRLTLTASQTSTGTPLFYEQSRSAAMHSAIGELLVYFRRRQSPIRPYLSAGSGVIHISSEQSSIAETLGTLQPVPGAFHSTKPALRVAVGIDVLIKHGWAFRFTFSETIRGNAISSQLTPPAKRNLANFQNLFGFVKHF
jgi:Outer membrane protein beta-barrel domain